MRPVPAPSAARIASSCCRDSARTSSRLATLAQAISSTTPIVAHQDPEHVPDVADEVVLEGHDVRREARLFEHLDVAARERRELRQRDRDQPRHLGVRLRDRRARLQPGDGRVAEVAEEHLAAIEAIGRDQRHAAIEEAERVRQHADDLARAAVDHQRLADDGVVGAELRSPVGRASGRRFRESPACRPPSRTGGRASAARRASAGRRRSRTAPALPPARPGR